MALAAPLRRIAQRMMARLGSKAVLRVNSPGAYDPSQGCITQNFQEIQINGVLELVRQREVNDLIRSGDRKLTIAAADLPAPPALADQVEIEGSKYQIVEIRTVEQDNTPITHELFIRN